MNEFEHFFKAYYSKMKDFYLEFEADEYELTKENYWDKVLKPSKISEEDFAPIKLKINLALLASFKDFYKSHYSLDKDFDTRGLFIAGNTENSKLLSLDNYFFDHAISSETTDLGLIPFGLYNDEWYVCIDMNRKQGDLSIVLFEMSNWGAGKEAISHRQRLSNFNSFLRCITYHQVNGNWDNFNDLDPGNNYLTAYDYWKNQTTT